jgi:hypothetical protein
LEAWLHDLDFAGVRDEAGLARLPETERPAWRAFWEQVKRAISSGG